MDWSWLPWLGVITLMLIGLVGLIFPLLPGATFLFAGMWLAAWLEDYQRISVTTVVVLGVFMLLSFAIDWLAGVLGAKKVGASRAAIIGAFVGSLLGILAGFWGLIVFPFFGAMLGEWLTHRDHFRATHVGFATALATAMGMAAKIALGFTMLGIFTLAWWLD